MRSGSLRAAEATPADLRDLDRLATWLDARYRIPGIGVRVGLDSLLGLVPGIGDTLAMLPAAYIVYRAHRLGAPVPVLARMAANFGVDLLVGSIPVLGDVFDVGFKANLRNIELLRRHLDASGRLPSTGAPRAR